MVFTFLTHQKSVLNQISFYMGALALNGPINFSPIFEKHGFRKAKEERDALYSLRNDTSIIIKEADKGSGTVV